MRRLLSDPEEQLLWKSVEDQKGIHSQWIDNFDQASAKFRDVLIARGNLQPPNSKQLQVIF